MFLAQPCLSTTGVDKNEENKTWFPPYINGEFNSQICQNNMVVKYAPHSAQMKEQVS